MDVVVEGILEGRQVDELVIKVLFSLLFDMLPISLKERHASCTKISAILLYTDLSLASAIPVRRLARSSLGESDFEGSSEVRVTL